MAVGKAGDDSDYDACNQGTYHVGGGICADVAVPQAVAQALDDRVAAAGHEDNELADPLTAWCAENDLHEDGEEQPCPQQPEAPCFDAEHGLLLHLVKLIFLAVQ